jgi:hypothetical protein
VGWLADILKNLLSSSSMKNDLAAVYLFCIEEREMQMLEMSQ